MSHSKKEVALLFSNGEFKKVQDHLSPDVVWTIVGEQVYTGKKEVIAYCDQTALYFQSVETDFKTNKEIESDSAVVIMGTAEFKKQGVRQAYISACDVYEFNNNNKIITITSYCMPSTT